MISNFDSVYFSTLFAQDEPREFSGHMQEASCASPDPDACCRANHKKMASDGFNEPDQLHWVPGHFRMRNGERQLIAGYYVRT